MCGPRSLLMVCEQLGVKTDITDIKGISDFDQKLGTSLLGLQKAASAKGLQSVAMKIGSTELTKYPAMAIAHLWGNHFVVVTKGDNDNLSVTSPPDRSVVMSNDDFSRQYSGFALFIAKDKESLPTADTSGPDLRADAYTYDLGYIQPGDRPGHVFTLANKGTADLLISRVETTCSCTQAFLSAGTRIPPGGNAKLTVEFDSSGRDGGQSQTVYVHSNDAVSPSVQFGIGGFVRPLYLTFSTRKLYLGSLRRHSGATADISIEDPGNSSLVVTKVTSDSKYLRTTLTRDNSDGLVYHVKVELLSSTPFGQYGSNIMIYSNHPKEPVVTIPVTAQVAGNLAAFPKQFFLGVVKKGQAASKTITISSTAKYPLTIERLDSPFRYLDVTSSADSKGQYVIIATLKDDAPIGFIHGMVVIHTNDDDESEIKIPVFAQKEE